MPRGDGTGPRGMGAMTGRAAGLCAGYGTPGFMNPVPGRGLGMGLGRGRGFWNRGFGGGFGRRNMFYATGLPGWTRFGGYAGPQMKLDPELEKRALTDEAAVVQAELDAIKKRLSELESEAETA